MSDSTRDRRPAASWDRYLEEPDDLLHYRSSRPAPGKVSLTSRLPAIMRAASGSAPRRVSPDVVPRSSSGRALPADLRRELGIALGTDLSSVRVHTGETSARSAKELSAKAYTIGQDIHFATGQYDPESTEGRRLIAHEVAHTVQQRGATGIQEKLEVSEPGDTYETEADAFASAFVAGGPAPSLTPVGAGRVARDPDGEDKGGDSKPIWAGSELSFKFLDKDFGVKLEEDGFTTSMKLAEVSWPSHKNVLGKDQGWSTSKTWNVPVAGPLGFTAGATVSGGLTAGASAEISGKAIEFPGGECSPANPDGNNKGMQITIGGSGKLEGKIAGEVSCGAFLGAPYANVALQGYIELAASGSVGAGLFGGVKIDPTGNPSGILLMTVPLVAEVKASGGAKITYEAVITSGEIAKWELGGFTIAKAWATAVIGYDFGTKAVIKDQGSHGVSWMPDLPEPKQVSKREMTPEEKKKYRAIDAREKREREGGSGSGPGVPPEAYEEDTVETSAPAPAPAPTTADEGECSIDDAPPPSTEECSADGWSMENDSTSGGGWSMEDHPTADS